MTLNYMTVNDSQLHLCFVLKLKALMPVLLKSPTSISSQYFREVTAQRMWTTVRQYQTA